MNIFVFNPPSIENIGYVREGRCEQRLSSFQYVMLPVSLTSIASVLKKADFNVKIVDAIAEKYNWDDLQNIIKNFRPELIIFNISTVTYHNDITIVSRLKPLLPETHFSSIGVHVTTTSRQTLQESLLDSVIRGEPEIICLKLAQALKDHQSLNQVRGLSFKNNNVIIENPSEDLIENLDSLPFPARELVKNELYTLPVINQPYTLLVPSRGCPHHCIFCTANIYYGKKLRFRSIENVIEEIKEIVNKFNIHYITMWSDTFTVRKDFVIGIAKKIIENKINVKWMCNSRVDTIDEEMLDWMGKSGCIGISFGIESSDQEVLDNVKKGINISQIEKAVQLTNKYNIESLAHIIFGLPGDTKEKILKTIRFIKKIQPSYAQFYCAIPFPGTPFYYQSVENKWLTTSDWSLFEINRAIISTPLLSAQELNKLRKAAYMQFYVSPSYIFNRLKKIKSLTDLWVNMKQAFSFMKSWVFEK